MTPVSSPRIPLFSLDRQYPAISREIDAAITKTTKRGMFTLSEEVDAFEKEFCSYIGVPFGVGVGSGTDALTLAVRALGLTHDDEIILPANVYPTAFGIALSGARIRLVDCGGDGLIDTAALPQAVTPRTKAVVAVHLYGNPVDIPALTRLLAAMGREDIAVIEDCAQSHGATVGRQVTGSMGTVSCFSFYPSKNLGAYGDGGMVCTSRADIARRVKQLRMYGETSRYNSIEISGVSRLDELQAAVLRVKLRHLPQWNNRRRVLFTRYMTVLGTGSAVSAGGTISHRITAAVPYRILQADDGSVHHLMVIETVHRDELKQYLLTNGIGSGIHYPVPIHLTPAFSGLGYTAGDFPVSERLSTECLSLPMYPELTDGEADEVSDTVVRFFARRNTS